MKAILNIRMLGLRAALLPVLAAGLLLQNAQAQSSNQNQTTDNKASGSSHAQAPSEGSKAAENDSAPTQKERAGGPQEGIKVHGHWVIDVRNPDGTLVTHREFENSYSKSTDLQNILGRQVSVGLWEIELDGPNYVYLMYEPPETRFPVSYKTLSVSATPQLTLSASFTAPASDTIQSVSSFEASCAANVAPATPCTNGTYRSFTTTGIYPPGVSFVEGQIVQVTVTITFS